MRFDHAFGDLQLIWNTFLDFETFTREADGDLNYFVEEWKEKMVRVQSAGCQYSDLLLGLKLLEKVNLSSDSIMSIISKLGSSHFNSDSFLVEVVTNLQAESGINGSSVKYNTKKNNQLETSEFNEEISVELDIISNLISCSYCPDKFFDAVSLSKHCQEFHQNENQEKVLISKKDLKPDPDLLKYSDCDKSFYLKEDLEEHQKSNDIDMTHRVDRYEIESVVQVWVGSPERSAENPKDDPLMSDEIKMEINSVIGFKSDINNVQAENESSEQMMTNSSDKFRCDICPREFTTVTNLRMHMVSHKTLVDFTCYHCGKKQKTKNALKYHVRKEHSNEPHYGRKKFPCEICGQQVAYAQKDIHVMKHFRDPFKCDICGKEFQEKSKFNNHMDNHRTTKDFMCAYCGKRFQNRNTRNGHRCQQRNLKRKEGETHNKVVTESGLKSGTSNGQIKTLVQSDGINKESYDSTPNDDLSFVPANKVHCKTCGKFIVKTSISRHKKIHTKNIFKCWICQKEFNMAFYLKTHLETHKETRDQICSYCGNAYKTRYILRRHMNYFCRKKTANSDNSSHSKEKITVENVISSFPKNTMTTETEEIFDKNPFEVPGENIEEVIKEKETIAVEVIKQKEANDLSLREGEGKIPCEICRKLITKHQMVNHIKVHRLSVQSQCEICGEIVEDCKMKKHVKVHRLSAQSQCEICGKIVKDSKMQKHIKVHRLSVQSQCEICGKIVKDCKMKKHLETQCEKNICSICQKQFKSSCNLKQHIESHNATRKYICSFCGKKYKTKMTLDVHINHHTKSKPLPCKFCDKIFYWYGARTFHIRAHHTGEKPYKCDICDERFYISTRKVEHMRKHTGEKPFSCDECGKKYSDSSSLKKHVMTVHKEDKSSDI